jgi:uncharacterized RDD family membrane protein YckC
MNSSASWKQEVNRRVAEHKKSKPSFATDLERPREHRTPPASRAAQAAARVAARYANAPSYSEVLATEARAAVLAAGAASRAALAAQAAAQSVLDTLEAASPAESAQLDLNAAEALGFAGDPAEEPATYEALTHPYAESSRERAYAVRWEPELPGQRPAPVPVRARQTPGLFDSRIQDWPEPGAMLEEGFELVEPAQPIPGNLIEFPRQLVATRKVRPRRVEGPLANTTEEAQLSIFEVDPGDISIEPEAMHPAPTSAAATWSEPEWCGMRLGAHPEEEESAHEAMPACASSFQAASASRRLLAVVVDFSLVTGAFLLLAFLAASRMTQFPGMRAMEVECAIALLVTGALYETLFFVLARTTPGMYYAQLRLCTLEGEPPTRAQRNARLVALLLSALPIGLGLAWAIFDEDHLAWHDRLSHTYLRRR